MTVSNTCGYSLFIATPQAPAEKQQMEQQEQHSSQEQRGDQPVNDAERPAAPSTSTAAIGDDSATRQDAPPNTYRSHAMREFRAAGWMREDGTFCDEMQGMICTHVLALLDVFAGEGHSGTSAPYAIGVFEKLAKFEPLVPLTGAEWEWAELSTGCFQNRRCSRVFKRADRFDGQPYDIEAVVFYDWLENELEPGDDGYPSVRRFKSHFTSGKSHRPITFPYTPTTVYEERAQGEA